MEDEAPCGHDRWVINLFGPVHTPYGSPDDDSQVSVVRIMLHVACC